MRSARVFAGAMTAVALVALAGCTGPGYGAPVRDVTFQIVPLAGAAEAGLSEAHAPRADSPEGPDVYVPAGAEPAAALAQEGPPARGWVVTWSRWDDVGGRERMKRAKQARLAGDSDAAAAELAELETRLEDVAAFRFEGLRATGSVEKTWQVLVVTRAGQWRHTSFNATTDREVTVEL